MYFASRRRPSRRKLLVEALENRRVMATVQGNIFLDSNIDGARGGAEALLTGSPVTVYVDFDNSGTRDAAEPFATTATGTYLINSPLIGAGTFAVRLDVAAPLAASNFRNVDVLDPLVIVTVEELGAYRLGEIRGQKFIDNNADGVKNSAETGRAGIQFQLTNLGTDGVLGGGDDTVLPAVTTDATGNFALINLTGGTYRLTELPDPNPDVKITTAAFSNFVINASGQLYVPDATFGVPDALQTRVTDTALLRGNFTLGRIHSYVFVDGNGNGIEDATDATPAPGVAPQLIWAGPDNNFATTADNQTITPIANTLGARSTLLFQRLEFGRYRFDTLTLPTGVVRTTPALTEVFSINADGVVYAPPSVAGGLAALESNTLAIGVFRNAEIRGHKFIDRNADGTKQSTEGGLAGVRFQLTNLGGDGLPGGGDDGAPIIVTSDANGDFAFTNLGRGTYQLLELDTTANIKTTTAAFTNFVVNASGQLFVQTTASGVPDVYQTRVVRPELRRGNFRLGEIFGYVFVDRNSNGVDNTETRGMPGVTMLLTWAGPDNNFATTADNTTQTLTPNATTGVFSATRLEFGRYQLQEQLPASVVRTTAAPGTFNINDSGLIYAPNNTLTTPDALQQFAPPRIELAVGTFRLGEIYGYSFVDRDGDGTDDADPRVTPGVTLVLTWAGPDNDFATAADNTTQTLTPNATTGLYSARNLVFGRYRLQEQLPTDVIRTTAALGIYTVDNSGLIYAATAALATPDPRQLPVIAQPELALGVFRLGVIRGYAFGDRNGDGIDSGTEPRGDAALTVPPEAQELRVQVRLTNLVNGATQSTTNDAAGVYTFSGLQAGNYQVEVTAINPTRKLTTSRTVGTLVVSSGSVYQAVGGLFAPLDAYQTSTVNPGLAVGSAKQAVIKGIVYLDRDGNGSQGAPATEPGMAGFTISLVGAGLDNIFGNTDDLIFTPIVTTSTGLYEFNVDARNPSGLLTAPPDILPGQFRVTITEPAHYTRGTGENFGTETRTITGVRLNDIVLGTGVTATLAANGDQTTRTNALLSFGVQRYAAIQGVAFNDLNANGIREATEQVVNGETFLLQGPAGFTARQVTTGASGIYLFDNLPAGTYTVSPILKSEVVNGVTQETQGRTKNYATVNAQLNNIYVAPGLDPRVAFERADSSTPPVERILLNTTATLEQGIVQLSKLEGTVFVDANANGTQDAGEAGQAGIQVAIRRISGGYQQDELAAERVLTTSTTGKYTFYVWPGTYDVAEVAPAGFESTTPRKRFTEYGLVNIESGVDKFAKPRWSFATSLEATGGVDNDLVVVDEVFDRAAPGNIGGVRIYRNLGTAGVKYQQIAFASGARPSYAVATQLDSDPALEIIVTTSGTPALPLTQPYNKSWGEVLILNLNASDTYDVVDPLTGAVVNPSTVGNRVRNVTQALGGDGPRHVSVANINGSVYLAIANERNYDNPGNVDVSNYHDVSIAKQSAANSLVFSKVRTIDVSTASVSANVITTAFGKFDGTNFSLAVPQYGLGRVEFFNPVTGAKVLTPLTGLQKPTHLLVGNFVQLPTDTASFDDLVVTENGGSLVSLYPQVNRQLGSKIVAGNIDRPTFASAADFDKDGDLDLAVASGGSGAVSLLYNQVPGLPTGSNPKFVNVPSLNVSTVTAVGGSTGASIMQAAFGDFNADGVLDLVTTPFTGGVTIHPSSLTTAGNWKSLQTIQAPANGVALGDKRTATNNSLADGLSVVPIASPTTLAGIYPTTGKLANSGLRTVPPNLAIQATAATITVLTVGNKRTSPAPLTLSTALRPEAVAFDLSGNGQIEPLDALLVINSLNSASTGTSNLDVNQDGVLTPLDALLVINEINTMNIVGSTVDTATAQSMFDAALERLSAESGRPELLAPLIGMSILTDDLPEGVLSWVTGNTLVVDTSASGRGWFVDSTPDSDTEFANGNMVAGVDLLSVLTHEIGHLLGLEDQLAGGEDEIMHAQLRSGERRLDADAVDRLVANLNIEV